MGWISKYRWPLLLTALIGAAALWFWQVKSPVHLDPDEIVLRPSPGGNTHAYRIAMETGQYAMVRLDQRGVDLEMTLYDPDNQRILFRNATQIDEEVLGWIAGKSGTYRLHITAYDQSREGEYRLALSGPRQPRGWDESCARASLAFMKALESSENPNAEPAVTEILFRAAHEAWAKAGETLQAGIVWWQEGSWWYRRRDLQRRLDCYLAAESYIGESGSKPLQARIMHNIGSAYTMLGRFEEGLQYYDRALAIRTAPDLDRASTLQAKAMAYRTAGAFQQALALFEEAGTIQTQFGDSGSRARYHNALGSLLLQMDQPAAALPHFEKAMPFSETLGLNFKLGTLDRLGQSLAKLGKFEMAKQAHFRAIEGMPKNYAYAAALRYNFGVTYLLAGEFQLAHDQLSQAASQFEAQASTDEWLYALFNLAKADQALGQCEQARARTIQALQLMDQTRRSTRSIALRRTFTAQRYAPLELLTDLSIGPQACGDQDEASLLAWLDHFRAAALSTPNTMQTPQNQPDTQVQQELEQLGDALNRMSLSEDFKGQPDPAENPEHNLMLVRYDQLMDAVRMDSLPDIPSTSTRPGPEPVMPISNPGSAVLYYAMGQERLYLIFQSHGETTTFDLGARETITADVLDFAHLIRDRETGVHRARIETLGKRLSALIPKAILDQTALRRLVIIPDGVLHQLSFAALPLPGSGAPLINRFELTFLPSMASLTVQSTDSGSTLGNIAVFADPVTGEAAIPSLPFAREEAEMIRQFRPNARIFLGPDARIGTAMDLVLGDFGLIHFATHGLLNSDRGELSALVLCGDGPANTASAAFLRASTIARLDLNAELVVLSACQTGLGKQVRGEGLVGLSHAFLQAGAGSVLASLWRIDDEATLWLMRAFYRHLFQSGSTVGQALQRAQAEMAAQQDWRDPYFWAGFRLTGDSQRTFK